MKIVIVGYDFRTEALAGSFRVRKLALAWKSQGHDVILISAHFDEGFRHEWGTDDGLILVSDVDHKKISSIQKIWRRAIGLPDPSALWAKRVKSNRSVRSVLLSSDILFVSSPPHGMQKIGVWATQKYGIPYIADLRDDFLTNHRINWRTPFHKNAAKRLEGDFVSAAAKVILNTVEVENRFKERYSIERKFLSVPNGYDKNDFLSLGKLPHAVERQPGRLIYVGSPYNGFAPKILARIADKLTALPTWELHVAGPGDWSLLKAKRNCVCYGLLSHQEASQLMATGDILLLFMPPGEKEPSGTIPLKTYSYLATGRFVLYFGEKGATSRILSEFGGTAVFSREDVEKLDSWLLKNVDSILEKCTYERPSLEKYEINNIALQINNVMSEVVNESN